MCPLCLTSLAVTAASTTGIGAAAVAVAARVAKSLARRGHEPDAADDAAEPRAADGRGDR